MCLKGEGAWFNYRKENVEQRGGDWDCRTHRLMNTLVDLYYTDTDTEIR